MSGNSKVKAPLQKWMLAVALSASVILNGYLIYTAVDAGVTSSYQSDALRERTQQLDTLRQLVSGYISDSSREELANRARELQLEVIEKGSSEMWIGAILFRFSDNKFQSMETF